VYKWTERVKEIGNHWSKTRLKLRILVMSVLQTVICKVRNSRHVLTFTTHNDILVCYTHDLSQVTSFIRT